jgi:hypothetical protein
MCGQGIRRGRERRYLTVVHARSVPNRVVDAELIRSECGARIANYVAAHPQIDVLASHGTPNSRRHPRHGRTIAQ